MKKLLVLAATASLFATAATATPANITTSRRADFYAAGKHQFYAWCAQGDHLVAQQGASAQDARARLSAATVGCRLTWQGRVRG